MPEATIIPKTAAISHDHLTRFLGSPAHFVKTGLDGLLEYNWESSARGGFPLNGAIATRPNCTQVGVV